MTAQVNRRAWKREALRLGFGDPKSLNPLLPDLKLQEICSKWSVPFVAGTEHLTIRDHILFDGHWNEKGHRRIEALLQGLYNDYVKTQQSLYACGAETLANGVKTRQTKL
jgi:hypothetical protein